MRCRVLIAVLLLAGCANVAEVDDLRAPRNAVEQREFDEQAVRLNRVTQRLWGAASSLCRVSEPSRCMVTHIGISPKIGAFAGEGRFIISTGLMKAMRSDDEIALVAAHEWAHSLLPNHGSGMPVAEMEFQADCLGTIISVAAGYDPAAGLRAYRDVMAPLERQQRAERVALLFAGMISITEYPPVENRVALIEATLRRVAPYLEQNRRMSRDDIRDICGVAP